MKNIYFEQSSKLKLIGGGKSQESSSSSYIIRIGAFENCTSLYSITIPANVETIQTNAFKNCTALTSVTFAIDSQLRMLDGNYFPGISSDMYHGAFTNCTNLLTFDATNCLDVKNINDAVFYNCKELRLVKIGTSVPPKCRCNSNHINPFYNINPYSVLKIPSGCSGAYKAARDWKNFASITGLDEWSYLPIRQTWTDGLYYTVPPKFVLSILLAYFINFSYIYIIIKDLITT